MKHHPDPEHIHSFLFEMYLATLDAGVLTWDHYWGEFCFIKKSVWKTLDTSTKEDLEVIKQFDKPLKKHDTKKNLHNMDQR